MIRLLVRLATGTDPVLAVFADLQGTPQIIAANVWARLGYLQRAGLISSRLQAAGIVARHGALDPEAGADLLLLVGLEVADEAALREGVQV